MIFLFIRINMKYIIIGRITCAFCEAALRLLKNKNMPYEFYDICTFDKESSLWQKKARLHMTIPVVYYNNEFIGGYRELLQHLSS